MAFDKKEYQRRYYLVYRQDHKENIAKRMKAYRAINQEKISAQRKIYRTENREKLRAYSQDYRQENKDKIQKQQKQWRERNRMHCNQKVNAYFKTPMGKLRNRANSARSRQMGNLSLAGIFRDVLFSNILKYGGEIVCEKCKNKTHLAFQFDHIVPLVRGGITDKNNLQILCARCNQSKGSLAAEYRFTPLLREANP